MVLALRVRRPGGTGLPDNRLQEEHDRQAGTGVSAGVLRAVAEAVHHHRADPGDAAHAV